MIHKIIIFTSIMFSSIVLAQEQTNVSAVPSIVPVAVVTTEIRSLEKVDAPDNKLWNAWLAKYVAPNGLISYKKALKDQTTPQIEEYIKYLTQIDIESLKGPAERLAYLINFYNATVICAILKQYPIKVIETEGTNAFFKKNGLTYRGTLISLETFEKEYILSRFDEPLLHFALYSAGYSSPRLASVAYVGDHLKQTLIDRTILCIKENSFAFKKDKKAKIVYYPQILDWYPKEFTGGPKEFYNRYAEKKVSDAYTFQVFPYNWTLLGNKPPVAK